METLTLPVLTLLDRGRSVLIRRTTSYAFARRIYCDRAARLQFLFTMTLCLNLTLSLYAPLWMIIIGPALFGTPHLFSSIRYSVLALERNFSMRAVDDRRHAIHGLFALFGIAAISRLFILNVHLAEANRIELGCLGLALLYFCLCFKTDKRNQVSGLALLSSLILCSAFFSDFTLVILLFAHNFVAFFFWWRAAQNSKEKKVILVSLASFILIHIAFFIGAFDGLVTLAQPSFTALNGHLDLYQIAKGMIPQNVTDTFLLRGILAFAFGQGVHYFLWLKVIPDQFYKQQAPPTFRHSFKLLKSDFGRRAFIMVCGLTFVMATLWIMTEIQWARGIYLSVSAFHGYAELGVLSLLLPQKTNG